MNDDKKVQLLEKMNAEKDLKIAELQDELDTLKSGSSAEFMAQKQKQLQEILEELKKTKEAYEKNMKEIEKFKTLYKEEVEKLVADLKKK